MTGRRVLLDENLPIRLRFWLVGVEAVSVESMGWKGIRNGELVERARAAGFSLLLAADRALAMAPRFWSPLGCVYVTSNNRARLQASAGKIAAACRSVLPGEVRTVDV